LYYLVVMLCSVFDFGYCCFDICLLYCIVLSSFVLFVCSVFPDKFHVWLSYDRIMDLQNDYMYVWIEEMTATICECTQTETTGHNLIHFSLCHLCFGMTLSSDNTVWVQQQHSAMSLITWTPDHGEKESLQEVQHKWHIHMADHQ